MDQNELTYIKIPYPHAKDLHLKITVPICTLDIFPGIGNVWVTGKYLDPKVVMPLNITHSENVAQIIAVGAFAYRTPKKYLPELKLSFGRLHPFSLSISAGDISDHINLGGIPLTSLEIQYGAGNQVLDFSYENPQVMSRMKVEAGGGLVEIDHLANASTGEIYLKGDTTNYRVDFGGEIKQNTNLHFGTAVSSGEITIPVNTPVKITSGSPPTSSSKDDFLYSEKAYWNKLARDQKEPLLHIFDAGLYDPLRLNYF